MDDQSRAVSHGAQAGGTEEARTAALVTSSRGESSKSVSDQVTRPESSRKSQSKPKPKSSRKPKAKPIPIPVEAFDDPHAREEETVHEVYEHIAPHFSQTRSKASVHFHLTSVKI